MKVSGTSRTPTIADAVLQSVEALQNPFSDMSKPDWSEQFRRDLKRLGVLDGLTREQQQDFTRSFLRLYEVDSAVPSITRPLARERQRWARESPQRLKRLVRMTETARNAVVALQEYLRRLHIGTGRTDTILADAIQVLSPIEIRDLQRLVPTVLANVSKVSQRRVDDALVALYQLFLQYGMPPGVSEYRAAVISNEFWETRFLVIERNSDNELARGCDAVRKRVRRRRLAGDTSTDPR